MTLPQIDSVPTSAPAAVPQPASGGEVGVRAFITINIDGCEPIVLPSIAKIIQLRDALNALIGLPPQLTIDLPDNLFTPHKVTCEPGEWVVTYGKIA